MECEVRLPSVCNFNPETTVLAHLGGAGTGRKHDDLFGSFCCSNCHAAIDGQMKTVYTKEELKLAHYDGVQRTQQIWLDSDLVTHK